MVVGWAPRWTGQTERTSLLTLGALTFFVYRTLLEAGIANPEAVSTSIKAAFGAHPNWRSSEKAVRELRQAITFAVFAECDSLEQVSSIVEGLFRVLEKAERNG
jgi:type I restriction enzyme R subunit